MDRQLRGIRLPSNMVAEKKTRGDYVCKYCRGKTTACNFVADICFQVYTHHQGMCRTYIETEKYVGYVTDCSTYHYQGISGEYRYEGGATMGQGVWLNGNRGKIWVMRASENRGPVFVWPQDQSECESRLYLNYSCNMLVADSFRRAVRTRGKKNRQSITGYEGSG